MNTGALLLMKSFLSDDDVDRIVERLEALPQENWKLVHEAGDYFSDNWQVIHLIRDNEPTEYFDMFPELKRFRDWCKAHIDILVFYKVKPDSKLHRHRDLSGTLEVGRLRFHVPLKTNEKCIFEVSKIPLKMVKGDIWALNTSYLHAVENNSNQDRIHLVAQVEVNEWAWSLLPKRNWKYYGHAIFFSLIVAKKAITSLLTNPKLIKKRFHQGKFFLRRFFTASR